jgi:hypothetical protein
MSLSTHYKVRVTRRGSPGLPFGWELCRRDTDEEIERSSGTYRSRHEALVEGERAAVARDQRPGDSPIA